MADYGYDYLSGIVQINEDAPEDWTTQSELYNFYHAPNKPQWGRKLSRVLFHESLHYWQFLSSGYLAELVTEEWERLLHFEEKNEILTSEKIQTYKTKAPDGFSAQELVECWARYWDIHSRGPHTIIEDEQIDVVDDNQINEITFDNVESYTGNAFDTCIIKGEDSQKYAEPYRWLLGLTKNSHMAAVIFPQIIQAAFDTSNPVSFFVHACKKAVKSKTIKQILSEELPDIHYGWINCWKPLWNEVIVPTQEELDLRVLEPGINVIQNSSLSTHPIFQHSMKHYKMLEGRSINAVPEIRQKFGDNHVVTLTYNACASAPYPFTFCLMGDPACKSLLGVDFQPPRINFKNIQFNASKPENPEETYKQEMDELQNRVSKFNRAKKAHSVGLPLDAFES